MIRPIVEGDFPVVLRLIGQAAINGTLLPRDEEYLRRHQAEFVVAAAHNRIVGCASLRVHSQRLAEVIAYATVPSLHLKSGGLALIRTCQNQARHQKIELVMVICTREEAVFLRKVGFGPATRKERWGVFWQTAEFVAPFDANYIRPARTGDYPAIRHLVSAAAERDELLPRSIKDIMDHGREFIVATGGGPTGPVIGCAALEVYGQELAEIRSLVVEPEWAGQNYGKHLVRACQVQAQKEKVKEVLAVTHEVGFFEGLNFRRAARQGCYAFFWGPA